MVLSELPSKTVLSQITPLIQLSVMCEEKFYTDCHGYKKTNLTQEILLSTIWNRDYRA